MAAQAARHSREMSPTLWTTISYHPGGAGSIPKMEPVLTCCFLLSAAGPLVTPMRWSMTCTRCSKELDNSPSLFSRCLFCRRDTALPGIWTHHSTYGTHTPACGAPTFPTPGMLPGDGDMDTTQWGYPQTSLQCPRTPW